MANNKIKRFLIAFVITLLLIISLTCFIFDKEPINEATHDEIQAIDGLGEILSHRIVIYIEFHPEADVDDLTEIYGIGPEKVKLLKEKFK